MIVLDTCAAVQIALGTQEGLALRSLILEDEEIIVPSHFNVELLSALCKIARGGLILKSNVALYYNAINKIITQRIDSNGFEAEVIHESFRLKHSAYDIFYLILARRNAATLLTVDKKLQKLCLENHVDCVLPVDISN